MNRRELLRRLAAVVAVPLMRFQRQAPPPLPVYGDATFGYEIRQALARIEQRGSCWTDYVSRALIAIRQDPQQQWLGGVNFVPMGTFLLGEAVFREIPQGVHPNWLAAAIVHEAAHAAAYYQGLRYYGACGEFYADIVTRAFWQDWPVRHPADVGEGRQLPGNPEVAERGSIIV